MPTIKAYEADESHARSTESQLDGDPEADCGIFEDYFDGRPEAVATFWRVNEPAPQSLRLDPQSLPLDPQSLRLER